MPLAPLIHYHFNQSWPTGTPRVIMTAARVWYPLVASALALLARLLLI